MKTDACPSKKRVRVGSRVAWAWQGRLIQGKVVAVYSERVQKVIKGKLITRNGSKERPAYLVVSDAGNEALKLSTELRSTEEVSGGLPSPRLFGD